MLGINDSKSIKVLQEEFQSHFPFLKLEFYHSEHEVGQGNPDENKIDSALTIGEIRNSNKSGDLSIHGNLKVSTLEESFHDTYGLNVQVFRKSGDLWLQTTVTDEWSLSEQNETARELAQ